MFENTGMTLGLYKTLLLLAQVGVDRGVDVQKTQRLSFRSAIIFCLNRGCGAGVRHQVVLTNLSVAVEFLGHQSELGYGM